MLGMTALFIVIGAGIFFLGFYVGFGIKVIKSGERV